MAKPTRQDTWNVTVRLQDLTNPNKPMNNLGTWDKKSGGELDSDESKYNPGGMAKSVSLGGKTTPGNITVSRLYVLERDHATLLPKAIAGAGRAQMEVHQQPLDIDGNTFGKPIVWKGTLKRVAFPEVDSESSDAAMIELEMTVAGDPGI